MAPDVHVVYRATHVHRTVSTVIRINGHHTGGVDQINIENKI